MARNRKLRPIDETRGPRGQFTSETAFRLYCRKGGLARARQQKADGYKMLNEMREKSILAHRLKAANRRECHRCASFAESALKSLESILKSLARVNPQVHEPLSAEDRRLLDGVGPVRPRSPLI
jgi:hypothetical protein